MPTDTARSPQPLPARPKACPTTLLVRAVADPASLPRILEPLVVLDVMPTRVEAQDNGDGSMRIVLQLAGAAHADRLAARLAALHAVETVSVERGGPSRVAA